MLDIFPKLNGLDGLVVTNLRKKEENNNLVELIMDNPIKNNIKEKDVIYFDLIFTDVWIDVTMTLEDYDDESKSNKISFELKIQIKDYKKELETTLANLGIRTWKQLKEQEEEQDYYLLSKLEIIYENTLPENKSKQLRASQKNVTDLSKIVIKKEFNSLSEDKNDSDFDFNNKIICTLIFINFTSHIYNISVNEIERRNKVKNDEYYSEEVNSIEDKKMNEIKFFFNNNFKSLYFNKNKNKNIIEIDKILCKLSPEYKYPEEEEEEAINYQIFYSTNNSPINSPIRFIGPFNPRKSAGKKEIEMEIIDTEKNNFPKRPYIKNDDSNSNSFLSMKLDDDSFDNNKDYNNIEEIKYIKNEIDFEKEIDKFDPYMLISSFNDSDIYRTRNLNFLDGEILKFNKLNTNKETEKKNSKEHKDNISSNEGEYSNNLYKKYAAILIIIILLIVLFKTLF